MELHKNLNIDKSNHGLSISLGYINYFEKALDFVNKYYKEDFDRIATTKFEELTTDVFFREYIWAVYVSGFNAKIISKIFPKLQEIYNPLFSTFANYNFNINTLDIMMNAMAIFANKRKTKAVIDMAFIGGEEIHKLSWEVYRNTKLNSPDKLKELPFIGEITKFHLARNCGQLQFVKPDVHLEKAAKFWHFQSPMEMCETIKEKFDMPVGLIDLVLWYSFSTFGSNY